MDQVDLMLRLASLTSSKNDSPKKIISIMGPVLPMPDEFLTVEEFNEARIEWNKKMQSLIESVQRIERLKGD